MAFPQKKHKLQAVCALLREFTARLVSLVTDSSLMWSVGFGASSQSAFGWVDVEGGCSQADRTGGDTGHKDNCDGWVGGCVGFVMQEEKAVWRSLKPERTPCGASSSPGKGRSEEGDGMG